VICVDTNVLVFSTVVGAPRHGEAKRAITQARARIELAVTAQIPREYVAATTHPRFAPRPLTLKNALEDVDRFLGKFRLLNETAASFRLFCDLIARQTIVGRKVHDANIAATMLANGVTRILTDNGADFRRFAPDIDVIDLA
jgi:predicted nucleic acid-binding protein